MTQVENSVSQFTELTQEQATQLDNFLSLLVELRIIEPSEHTSFTQQESFTGENEQLENCLQTVMGLDKQNLPEFTNNLNEGGFDSCSCTLEDVSDKATPEQQNSEHSDEASLAAFQKLQKLLVGYELAELNNIAASIQENISKLQHQIYQPQELINLLLPSITEILKQKVAESETAPEELAEALAPTIGRAIQKQIEIEQDTVVDALYPIIGSTISKYMAETIRAINEQIEQTISFEGIQRKIRAKLQGVSEAELILKEALPFSVQAIFLIHKASGLVICDIQPDDAQHLESDMVAGMLTAIRSFANDCISQTGTVSELNAIDYGTFKITLEVAGYCYLAIVVQGEIRKNFIVKMRKILIKIVKSYSKSIEQFDGDPDTIPSQVCTLLETLNYHHQQQQQKNQSSPLMLLSLTVISVILIPWSIWQYRSAVIHSIENKTALALASAPTLAVYRLTVEEHQGKLKLTGKVPNQLLSLQAEKIASSAAPKWLIDNQILSVEVPVDPVLAAAEVARVTTVLNRMDGTAISSQYIDGKVSVEGKISRNADAMTITHTFEQIPGVKSVSSVVRVEKIRIEVRFYFEPDSATLSINDLGYKLGQVKLFLNQNPLNNFKIIGYSYSVMNTIETRQLALMRAKAVQKALIEQGVDPSRLQVMGKTDLPPGIDVSQPEWLSRCVVLEER